MDLWTWYGIFHTCLASAYLFCVLNVSAFHDVFNFWTSSNIDHCTHIMNILMPDIPCVSQTLRKKIPNLHQSVFQFPPLYAPCCCVLHLKTPPRFYYFLHHQRYGQVFSLKWIGNIAIAPEGCESHRYGVYVESYASYYPVSQRLITWQECDLHTSDDGCPLSSRLF